MVYYGANIAARRQNLAKYFELFTPLVDGLNVVRSEFLPVHEGCQLGVVFTSTVVGLGGQYMELENGTKMHNPRPIKGESMAESLQGTVKRGRNIAMPIETVVWLLFEDSGGWFQATLQGITPKWVLDFVCGDGDSYDLLLKGDGKLYTVKGATETVVPHAREPPIHAGVWTSMGVGYRCANGWHLEQVVRVDAPPPHQAAVSQWAQQQSSHTQSNVTGKVGDVVRCKQNTSSKVANHKNVVTFFGVLVKVELNQVQVRHLFDPWSERNWMRARTCPQVLQEAQPGRCIDVNLSLQQLGNQYELWGSNSQEVMDRFKRVFGVNGVGWDGNRECKQKLLSLEQALYWNAMRDQCKWRAMMGGWRDSVCLALSRNTLVELLVQLLGAIKVEKHRIEVLFSQVEDMLRRGGVLRAARYCWDFLAASGALQ